MDPQSAPSDQATPGCLECGEPCSGKFCPPPSECKSDWNNRRQRQGARLRDLMMSLRYNRDEANADKVMTLAYRLMAEWRDEDMRERDGRRSWRPHQDVIRENPYLTALVSNIKIGRKPL